MLVWTDTIDIAKLSSAQYFTSLINNQLLERYLTHGNIHSHGVSVEEVCAAAAPLCVAPGPHAGEGGAGRALLRPRVARPHVEVGVPRPAQLSGPVPAKQVAEAETGNHH